MKRWSQSPIILGYFIGFIAFFAPMLGFIASKGLAPLVIVGSAFCVLILRIQNRPVKGISWPIYLILSCFCLWALVSSFWSIDVVASVIGSARLFGNILVGGFLFIAVKSLTPEEKILVFKFFLAGFAIAIGIVVFEILLGGPIFITLKDKAYSIQRVWQGEYSGIYWLNPVMVVLSLFIWPIFVGLHKKLIRFNSNKYLILYMILGFLCIFILTLIIGFSSGTVAIFCGLLGTTIMLILGKRIAIVAALVMTLVSFSLPFGFNASQNPMSNISSLLDIPMSAAHRIGIWKFTSDRVVERPFIGWGMNASKNIPGGKSFLYSDSGKHIGRALPLHPHNVILQIWLELGLPGIVLFVSLCIFIIMTSINQFKFESAMIFGQFITVLGISNLSFGMWQAWWIAIIWLSASLMLLVSRSEEDDKF